MNGRIEHKRRAAKLLSKRDRRDRKARLKQAGSSTGQAGKGKTTPPSAEGTSPHRGRPDGCNVSLRQLNLGAEKSELATLAQSGPKLESLKVEIIPPVVSLPVFTRLQNVGTYRHFGRACPEVKSVRLRKVVRVRQLESFKCSQQR
jgi:hypothetical protein